MARRYLGMSAEEWRGLPWDLQRTYLEGMDRDETVPLTVEKGGERDMPPGMPPEVQQRTAEVSSPIDFEAMIAELSGGR